MRWMWICCGTETTSSRTTIHQQYMLSSILSHQLFRLHSLVCLFFFLSFFLVCISIYFPDNCNFTIHSRIRTNWLPTAIPLNFGCFVRYLFGLHRIFDCQKASAHWVRSMKIWNEKEKNQRIVAKELLLYIVVVVDIFMFSSVVCYLNMSPTYFNFSRKFTIINIKHFFFQWGKEKKLSTLMEVTRCNNKENNIRLNDIK